MYTGTYKWTHLCIYKENILLEDILHNKGKEMTEKPAPGVYCSHESKKQNKQKKQHTSLCSFTWVKLFNSPQLQLFYPIKKKLKRVCRHQFLVKIQSKIFHMMYINKNSSPDYSFIFCLLPSCHPGLLTHDLWNTNYSSDRAQTHALSYYVI